MKSGTRPAERSPRASSASSSRRHRRLNQRPRLLQRPPQRQRLADPLPRDLPQLQPQHRHLRRAGRLQTLLHPLMAAHTTRHCHMKRSSFICATAAAIVMAGALGARPSPPRAPRSASTAGRWPLSLAGAGAAERCGIAAIVTRCRSAACPSAQSVSAATTSPAKSTTCTGSRTSRARTGRWTPQRRRAAALACST